MSHVASMEELHERRTYECRLTPDRALESLEEAEAFLLDRGLLTRTVDCALPSLFAACHEEPYAPSSPGFGQWPRTKFPWFGQLGARGYPILSVHRGKNLLVSPETGRLLDPLCRAELERCGALVSRSIVYEDPHRHTSELARWDQVVPEASGGGGVANLIVAGVRAAVVAPEKELRRWFSWWDDAVLEDERLVRVDGHVALI